MLNPKNHHQGQYGGGSQRKTSGTLHMANVTKADQGIYVCITHNPMLNISKKSHAATLTVYGEIYCSSSTKCFVKHISLLYIHTITYVFKSHCLDKLKLILSLFLPAQVPA